MKTGDALATYRGAFSFDDAKIALGCMGLYEAAGNLFWLHHLMPYWGGQKLKGTDVTWTQLVAARTLWDSKARLASCPENEALRRLSFPTFLPSAVGDLKEL